MPKTTAAAVGSAECERCRYRTGALGASPVPGDESLGLVAGCPARRTSHLSVPATSHCPPREAHAFFRGRGALAPSASTLQRVARSMHAEWDATAQEAGRMIRSGADIPGEAASVAASLDGIMAPLARSGDGGSGKSWREAACGTVSFRDGEGGRLKTL